MKIARILHGKQETFAIVTEDGNAITRDELINQTRLLLPFHIEEFIFKQSFQKINEYGVNSLSFNHHITEFHLLPPIKKSFKIICLAFNYTDQGSWVRFGKNPPKEPVIYLKPRTALIGSGDDIICPNFVNELDYEGELAFAIGKNCRKVHEADALKYVAGYFILNDISARDIQFVDKQYTRAKGFDTFGPCGPWLTTSDEIPDPCNLHLSTKVNGETRQDSYTKNLVLDVNKIIQSLSKAMTLEPGDIISTGTPSGTALSMSSNLKYLKHNDIVEVEIEKLGKITNRVMFAK
ncbi:MAG: fumarylacetoacetate hydrolase family protein [Thermoproteota archaeon]|nr:fumarylacetoacetate hydrolase family protein [Thermoproteota archaeon]